MLTRLHIANLATIDSLEIEFGGRFTVLTGETGAGKSILIDALRFVLGGKASVDHIRTGSDHVVVEAIFDVTGDTEIKEILEESEIPFGGELVLRRTMQKSGRSRAVVNDCSLTQAKLEQLGSYLINIHGQHDNQLLLRPETHIQFLDTFGGLADLREETGHVFREYSQLTKEKKILLEEADQREQQKTDMAEQISELQNANLKPGELKELSQEHARLSNVDTLTRLTGELCEALYESDEALLPRLAAQKENLAQASRLDEKLVLFSDQLPPILASLEDLYRGINSYHTGLESDPNRLDHLNTRLAEIEKIQRRYGGSEESALASLREMEEKLESLSKSEERLESIQGELSQVAKRLHELAGRLSQARADSATKLDDAVMAQFLELGMEKAIFKTNLQQMFGADGKTPLHTAQGKDQVEFLLTTNPGQNLRPLSRIASGGELSRTMLAIKTVLAEGDPTHSLIFDEVDAGISGATAEQVGKKLQDLARSHQVLCVTHLPQIASMSGQHLLVSKDTSSADTFTTVQSLDEQGKVREIARLLSGIDITEQSLASASEMVKKGNRPTEAGE